MRSGRAQADPFELDSATAARAGWVYLVGAGPGDPDLVTVRGAQLLASADVVLHDELIDAALLDRAVGERRSVGKRGHEPGARDARQDAIIAELIAEARAGRSVVRLKGGDPFLFGRGSEEAMALRRAAIPFEVVPGVVSPVGATAYAGVPLTHRSLSSSVTFVTAVTRDGAPFDFGELAGLRGTVCVLMGTRHLDRVCRGLMDVAGRAGDTPAVVVEWISYPRQRTVEGTLAEIAQAAVEAGIGAPSLLIVGAVAGLRAELRWFDEQPLFGKRVLVTRPAEQIAATARLLRRRGAEPIALPTIAIAPPPDPQAVAEAVRRVGDYDLVTFTSANAVEWLWREIDAQGKDARIFGRARVAAIGPATAAALARYGVRADIVAETFVAEPLAEAILADLGDAAGKRALLPRALVAREALPDILRQAGMQVDVVPVYQTVPASTPSDLAAALERGVDVITLTSSSTAAELHALAGGNVEALAGCLLASIGPITTRTAEALGLRVAVTAEVSTSEGLVDALERALGVA